MSYPYYNPYYTDEREMDIFSYNRETNQIKMHRIYVNLYKGIKLEYDYNTFNIRNLYISIGSRISFCTILIDRYVSHIYVKLYKCIKSNVDGYPNFLGLKS